MTERVLVTGALGNVGGEVVRALSGKALIRAALTPWEYEEPPAKPDDIERYVPFLFEDPGLYLEALEGVTRLFLMRPPHISAPAVIAPTIEAAKQAGVRQIVFLSLQGAERNRVVPHAKIESLLLTCGVPYTFLRPSFFMQNLSTQHRDEIRTRNEIFVPAGKGKTSFIDVRDIGAVAAKTLTEPGHDNRAYTLTGSEALDYFTVARMLSDELGREIRYANPSLIRFIQRKRSEGLNWGFVLVMTGIYTTARLGRAGGLTSTVSDLLGRPPITMAQFLHDFRDVWL